jgi:hypothetical protein
MSPHFRVFLPFLSLLSLGAILGLPATAAAKTLGVSPLVGKTGVDPLVVLNITSLIASEADFSGSFDNVKQFETMPGEMNFNCLGQGACLASVARKENVDLLIAGSVAKVGQEFDLGLVYFDRGANTVIRKKNWRISAEPSTMADRMTSLVKEILTGQSAAQAKQASSLGDLGDIRATKALDEEGFTFDSAPSPSRTIAVPKSAGRDLEDVSDDDFDAAMEREERSTSAASSKKAQEEAARKKAEQDRIAQEEARRKAAEEARLKAEQERLAREEAARKAAEEARLKAQEQARVKAEQERVAREAEARRKEEEIARKKAEQEKLLARAGTPTRGKPASASKSPPPEDDDFEIAPVDPSEMEDIEFAFVDPSEMGSEPAPASASTSKSTASTSKSTASTSKSTASTSKSTTAASSPSSARTTSGYDLAPAPKARSYADEDLDRPARTGPVRKSTAFDDDPLADTDAYEDLDAPSSRKSTTSKGLDAPSSRKSTTSKGLDEPSSRKSTTLRDLDEKPTRSSRIDSDVRGPRVIREKERFSDRQSPTIAGRIGTSRYDVLQFLTYGAEIAIPVGGGVFVGGGIDGYSVKRTVPVISSACPSAAIEEGENGQVRSCWNSILPIHLGARWQTGQGVARPFVGADFLTTPYHRDLTGDLVLSDLAWGLRLRPGLDLMTSESFGITLDAGLGFLRGGAFEDAGVANSGFNWQVSIGTVIQL